MGKVSELMKDCLSEGNVPSLQCLQQKVIEEFDVEISLPTIH